MKTLIKILAVKLLFVGLVACGSNNPVTTNNNNNPPVCTDTQALVNGVCVDIVIVPVPTPTPPVATPVPTATPEIVCAEGQHLEGDVCVDNLPVECPAGQHLEDDVCVDNPPVGGPARMVLCNIDGNVRLVLAGTCVKPGPTLAQQCEDEAFYFAHKIECLSLVDAEEDAAEREEAVRGGAFPDVRDPVIELADNEDDPSGPVIICRFDSIQGRMICN